MRKLNFGKIRYISIISLLILAFAVCYPVHRKIEKSAESLINRVFTLIKDTAYLDITYKRISPSLISSVYLTDISVKTLDGKTVGDIDKIRCNYSLKDLFKIDIQNGVTNVLIDGLKLDLENLLTYIFYMADIYGDDIPNDFDFLTLYQYIPGSIRLKNISVIYNNDYVNSTVLLKDLNLLNQKNKSLAFQAVANGFLDIPGSNQKFSCGLNLNGTLLPQLDNSAVTVKVSNFTNGQYKISKLSFLGSYCKNVFEVHTVQSVKPFFVSADYNVETGVANGILEAKNFYPVSLVSSNSNSSLLKKLKNICLSTYSSVSYDSINQKLSYFSDGNISVPKELFPAGIIADYSLKGDEKQIDIIRFDVEGEKLNASLNLELVYKTLQAAGLAELKNFTLPNGKDISAEVYFDSREKGFMAFSPQIFIGDKSITALQLSFMPESDSYDFSLEAYDYSHSEDGEPGLLRFDGSYLLSSKYLQSSSQLNSLYVDSILDFVKEAAPSNLAGTLDSIKSAAGTFMLSTDAYMSTNFSSVLFNVPYVLVANTEKENQVVMLSLNGNDTSFQLNQLSLIFGNFALDLAATLDINPETLDMFFTTDIRSSSIPYHFSGSYLNRQIVISGDYGTDVEVKFGKKNLTGKVMFENLPFAYNDFSFMFSLDTKFAYSNENGPSVQLQRFAVEQANSNYSVSPKLIMSGNVTKYGAQLNSITYADYFSTLDGSADLVVNIADGILNSIGFSADLDNAISAEAIHLDASLANPDLLPFSAEALMNSMYLNAQANVTDFNLNRFTLLNNDNNVLSASVNASGTIEHPYVSVNIDKASVLLSTDFLVMKGSAFLEDRFFTLVDMDVDFAGVKFYDFAGDFSLDSFTGGIKGDIGVGIVGKDLHVPVAVSIEDSVLSKKSFLPQTFVAKVTVDPIYGGLVKKPVGFELMALYADQIVSFNSSEILGISGQYNGKEQSLSCRLDNKKSLFGNIEGVFNKDLQQLFITDLNIDLQKILSYLDVDELISIKRGIVKGDFGITGNFDDPTFLGELSIEHPIIKLPMVFDQMLSCDKLVLTAQNNEFHVLENTYKLKDAKKIIAACDVYLNKWSADSIHAFVKSYEKEFIPINLKTPFLTVDGDFMCDVKLALEGSAVNLEGKVFGDNLSVISSLTSVASNIPSGNSEENSGSDFSVVTDLNVTLGTHVSVAFNPVLRCVLVPNTNVVIRLDTNSGNYYIDGAVNLKSGDVSYLNRNFYIKSGSIKFNPTDLANPQITLIAETREKDEKGQNVKIVLSAENQYLSALSPHFSSVPAKSENDIRKLLGQIILADSNNATDMLVAAGDFAIQSTVMRGTENKLRDLLNFDIFSLRTNVFQNTVNLGMEGTLSNDTVTFSNLFDNSTVYIGKYLGSYLYLDAMLQISVTDSIGNNLMAPGALVLQPEFGLEVEAPFANIRWNIAPDLSAIMNNQFIPATSLSVSWKLSF